MKRITAKRMTAACLILALALGLAGCALRGESGAALAAPPAASPAPTLAFFGSSNRPWSRELGEAASEWCAQAGWALVEYDSLGLETTRSVQIDDLLRWGGADLAVLCADGSQESLEAQTAALAARGLRVITVSEGPLTRPAEALCHLGADGAALWEAAADFLREETGEAETLILRDSSLSPLEEEARPALEEAGIRVAEELYTWGSVEYARSFVRDALARHGQAGGVLCFSRTGAVGARGALAEAGRLGEVRILCLGATQALLTDLERGEVDALATLSGREAADALAGALTQAAQGTAPADVALGVELRRAGR